jgi:hypothetical protein
MDDLKDVYDLPDLKTYLESVKVQQEKINKKMEWHVDQYNGILKIWKANENLIVSIEESLGLREPKKPKSKAQEDAAAANTDNKLNNMADYDANGTVAEKAAFALEKTGKELTTNQILEFLYTVDNTISKDNHRDLMSKFSATLIQKLNKNEIFYRRENENKDFVWGLKANKKFDVEKLYASYIDGAKQNSEAK